jgi:methylmalonyl-CoA/ethylmalonyl-CoA epimerase
MPKSLGWKRFDHYSIAVPDAEKTIAFHQKLFGLTENHPFTSGAEGFTGAVLDMPKKQGQIEILEPDGDDSFLHKFLERNGPGVHHITIEVDDIEQAAAFLREEMGIEPYRGIWSDGEWKQTFIHPRDSGGVLYQLFEWEEGKRPEGLPE